MKVTVVFKRPLPSAHLYVMMHSCWLRKDGQLRIPVVCCSHLLLGWTRVDAYHTFLAWLCLSHTALLAIWPCEVFQAISEDLLQVSMHLKLTYLAFYTCPWYYYAWRFNLIQIKLGWALFVTYTIIQSIMRSEMCSLHLTHPSGHTWSSGQPTVQRPGSSHGLPVGAGIRTHNLGFQVQRSIH